MDAVVVPEPFHGVIGLGRPLKVFRVSVRSAAGTTIVAVIFSLMLISLLVIIVFSFFEEDVNLIIIAVLFLGGIGLWNAYYLYRYLANALSALRTTVLLCEGGLAVSQAGKSVMAFPWDDIREYSLEMNEGKIHGTLVIARNYKLTLSGSTGTVVLHSPLTGVEQIIQAVRMFAKPRISADLIAQFKQGKTVDFKGLSIHPVNGIHVKNRTILWGELKNIWIANGYLFIFSTGGKWIGNTNLPLNSIINIDSLADILREEFQTHFQKSI